MARRKFTDFKGLSLSNIAGDADAMELSDFNDSSLAERATRTTGVADEHTPGNMDSPVHQNAESLVSRDGKLWRLPVEPMIHTSRAALKHSEFEDEQVKLYHQTCNRMYRAWKCDPEEFLPDELEETTPYSFALLQHMRSIASHTKQFRVRGHKLLLDAWRERLQTAIAQDLDVPALVRTEVALTAPRTKCERVITERPDGLMLIDVQRARTMEAQKRKMARTKQKQQTWNAQAEAADRAVKRRRAEKLNAPSRRQPPAQDVELVDFELTEGFPADKSFLEFLPLQRADLSTKKEIAKAKRKAKQARSVAEMAQTRRVLALTQSKQRGQYDQQHQPSEEPSEDDSDIEDADTTHDLESLADQDPIRLSKANKKTNSVMSHHMREFTMDPDWQRKDRDQRINLLKKRTAAKSKVLPSERFDIGAMPSLHSTIGNGKVDDAAKTLNKLSLAGQQPLPLLIKDEEIR